MRDPRSAVLRFGLSAVFVLYKTPLRGLLARLYLLIVHRGRISGRIYETLVTILHRNEATGEIFVTSSMQGERADWYRNLKVNPPVAIEIGSSRLQVTQRFLGEEERLNLYRVVCAERPIRARIGLFVTGHRWPRTQHDYLRLARDMPALAFTPILASSSAGPPVTRQ